jgi:DNA-binding IclR family transcriptional regulator
VHGSARRPDRSAADGAAAPKQVPAVAKAIAIIRHLNAASSLGLPLGDIAADLGMTKSHCHNILKTLVAQGWATFDSGRRRYALAPRLLADASALLLRQDRSAIVHDELIRLSLETRVACVLTRLDRDGSFVTVDKAEEAGELIVSVPVGHRFPADAPAQMRARLAFSDETVCQSAIRKWKPVRYTPTTIVDKNELRREIAATAARGYAVSREEFSPGVMSFAVPIYDAFGEVQMILQCTGLAAAMAQREQEIAAALRRAADRINVILPSA